MEKLIFCDPDSNEVIEFAADVKLQQPEGENTDLKHKATQLRLFSSDASVVKTQRTTQSSTVYLRTYGNRTRSVKHIVAASRLLNLQ
ncbi:hypothetical protein J6590_053648 [Homalodisca vitripennis]|nr:hypothetical protein J6590_053648 [Homalodisca vitripennis]